MHEHLYKYLVLYHKLSIPQLGSFSMVNGPAHFAMSDGLLYAPTPTILFVAGDMPFSDKFFFEFLAEEMRVDEVSAIKEFHDFSYQFRYDLGENRLAVLPGVGTLTKTEEGEISFTAETNLLELLPTVEPGKHIRIANKTAAKELIKGNTHVIVEEMEEDIEISRKDYWWVYAIILLVTGSVALLFYYQ